MLGGKRVESAPTYSIQVTLRVGAPLYETSGGRPTRAQNTCNPCADYFLQKKVIHLAKGAVFCIQRWGSAKMEARPLKKEFKVRL